MIKAIFFDIDGTLVSIKTHQIPASAKEALYALRQKGILVFIATGRPPCNITFLKDLTDFAFDGYVTMNGQHCFTGDTLLRDVALPRESVRMILPYLEQENISCDFITLDTYFLNLVNERALNQARMLKFADPHKRVRDVSYALTHRIYQLSPFITEKEEADFLSHIPGCKAARWHPTFTDIIPADGGKPKGMDVMLAHFGLTPEESMAFGDGGNDLDMLAHASIGVAMGNATDKAKAAADYITDDVDCDGVAKALKHFGILS